MTKFLSNPSLPYALIYNSRLGGLIKIRTKIKQENFFYIIVKNFQLKKPKKRDESKK